MSRPENRRGIACHLTLCNFNSPWRFEFARRPAIRLAAASGNAAIISRQGIASELRSWANQSDDAAIAAIAVTAIKTESVPTAHLNDG